jgi:hypothetical protein
MADTVQESAADYLSKTNWKTLVEYLTAEIVFNRPENPISYVREVLNNSSGNNDGSGGVAEEKYDPSVASEWLKKCYADASKNVDGNGVLKTRSQKPAATSTQSPSASPSLSASLNNQLAEEISELKRKINTLEKLLGG